MTSSADGSATADLVQSYFSRELRALVDVDLVDDTRSDFTLQVGVLKSRCVYALTALVTHDGLPQKALRSTLLEQKLSESQIAALTSLFAGITDRDWDAFVIKIPEHLRDASVELVAEIDTQIFEKHRQSLRRAVAKTK